MTAIRVVLADDDPQNRAGSRALLNSIAGVEVVGEASNGREAMALIEQHQPQVANGESGQVQYLPRRCHARLGRDRDCHPKANRPTCRATPASCWTVPAPRYATT
jgi:PleD family two-component response regulator